MTLQPGQSGQAGCRGGRLDSGNTERNITPDSTEGTGEEEGEEGTGLLLRSALCSQFTGFFFLFSEIN